MVRVCVDTLNPKSKRAGFYMDDVLKANLDIWIKNIKNDWDFCLVISGSGRVRIGKSVLAQQVAYYWCHQMKKVHNIDVPFNVKDNIVFHGAELIKKGNILGEKHRYSPLIFDEAGADLESMKVMRASTQAVKDFLRECGQYNLLTILVIPEFFDLPKGIATTRSDALINCFTETDKDDKFIRGFYEVFNRKGKKWLYINGKKTHDYKSQKYDFHGRFYNNYVIDEVKYKQAKIDALKTREITQLKDNHTAQRNLMFKFCIDNGHSQTEIVEYFKKRGIILSQQAISKAITITNSQKYNNIVYKEDDVGDDDGSINRSDEDE